MIIEEWDSKFQLKPSDKTIHVIEKPTGLVDGFNEGKGIDEFINLSKSCFYIDFDYDYKNIEAFHQPELSFRDKIDNIHRPDYVINSIAFYHSSKRNNEYKTGKIGHLYRPMMVDANGYSTWCDWTIERLGIIRLWLDKTFLKIGTSPFRIMPVGDTFGYTSTPSSDCTGGDGTYLAAGETYTCSAGTGVSITICAQASAGTTKAKMAVYKDDDTLLTNGASAEITNITAKTTYTANFSSAPTLASGTNYRLVMVTDATTTYFWFDTAGSAYKYYWGSYATFPATPIAAWSGTGGARRFGIYCTYTSSASPKVIRPVHQKMMMAGLL